MAQFFYWLYLLVGEVRWPSGKIQQWSLMVDEVFWWCLVVYLKKWVWESILQDMEEEWTNLGSVVVWIMIDDSDWLWRLIDVCRDIRWISAGLRSLAWVIAWTGIRSRECDTVDNICTYLDEWSLASFFRCFWWVLEHIYSFLIKACSWVISVKVGIVICSIRFFSLQLWRFLRNSGILFAFLLRSTKIQIFAKRSQLVFDMVFCQILFQQESLVLSLIHI